MFMNVVEQNMNQVSKLLEQHKVDNMEDILDYYSISNANNESR